jgi:molybdenum-dependent DNA-binding transcriptional regulator ModE
MRPKLKVWVTFGDELKFGDGRARLLELIDEHGSLSKAAESLAMSYRHAWGYLRELERAAGFKFVERMPGRVVHRYRKFRTGLEGAMKRQFERSFRS